MQLNCKMVGFRKFSDSKKENMYYVGSFVAPETGAFDTFLSASDFAELSQKDYLSDVILEYHLEVNQKKSLVVRVDNLII